MFSTHPINKAAPHRGMLRYTSHPSEFEVHACLYAMLLRAGYFVRAELSTHHGRARFDLVIFDDDHNPIRIIEVKRSRGRGGKKQVNDYYERFGIPVDFVRCMADAKAYASRLASILPPPSRAGELLSRLGVTWHN